MKLTACWYYLFFLTLCNQVLAQSCVHDGVVRIVS